jgi:hypothetical protein
MLNSVDQATNWSVSYASAGPYFIDTVPPCRPDESRLEHPDKRNLDHESRRDRDLDRSQ